MTQSPSPFTPAANASGVSSIPGTLAGNCPDHHSPRILCATCDDRPATVPRRAFVEDPRILVPFPPPEPAEMWREYGRNLDAAFDDAQRELNRLQMGMARLRATCKAAAFSAAIGSTSEVDLHRSALGTFSAFQFDLTALTISLAELSILYEFHAPRLDLGKMAQDSRAYHARHATGAAQ